MNLLYLIPIALVLGLAALLGFLWALKSGQYEDMEGAANRILFEDEDDGPVNREKKGGAQKADENEEGEPSPPSERTDPKNTAD